MWLLGAEAGRGARRFASRVSLLSRRCRDIPAPSCPTRLLSSGDTPKIRSPFEVVPNSQMETPYSEKEVEEWLNEQELIATEEEQGEAAIGS